MNKQSCDWLWENWIPRGMVTLLAAPPNSGASYLALDIAHRVTSGLPFPFECGGNPPANVVYVDADDIAPIISERLKAWNADLSKIYLMQSKYAEGDYLIDLNEQHYQDTLIEMTHQVVPSLIIVDSLSTAVSNVRSSTKVKTALRFLHRLAQEANSALLLVHRNTLKAKKWSPMTLSDVSGPSEITITPKVVWGLTGGNDERRVDVIKNIASGQCPSIGFRLSPIPDQEQVRLEFFSA